MNSEPDVREGDWVYVQPHKVTGKVIEKCCLWGNTSFRVWLPSADSIVRVSASDFCPLSPQSSSLSTPSQFSALSPHYLDYVAAAARVADALTQDVLLAPIESSVIPLPHQIRALSRAIANDRVRYLLADEVGLGKTIEAGLIMRELKLRGLVKRTLVIAVKGLVTQWVAEMRTHFNEHFQLVLPEDIKTLSRFSAVPSSEFRVPGSEDSQPTTRGLSCYRWSCRWIRLSPWISAAAGLPPRWASTTASGSRT